jgi:hypothetical protein
VRVVADSHAIVWYVQGSSRLSEGARYALVESEQSEGIAGRPLVRHPNHAIDRRRRRRPLQARLDASANVDLHAIDVAVADPSR